jgi:hypothetical protein
MITSALLGLAVVVLSLLVVHYWREATPTAPPTAGSRSAPPPVNTAGFTLLNGQMHLQLVAIAGTTGSGTLVITGTLTGGTPSRRYVLTGGDCTANVDFKKPLATGVANASGIVYLRGPVRHLPALDDYYLFLGPWPYRLGHPAQNGLYGSWLQGDGSPLMDHQQPCL